MYTLILDEKEIDLLHAAVEMMAAQGNLPITWNKGGESSTCGIEFGKLHLKLQQQTSVLGSVEEKIKAPKKTK